MTVGAVPVQLGWTLHDPGPPPRSPALDDVPFSHDPAEALRLHDKWRQAVLQHEAHLARQHAAAKVWFPVRTNRGGAVLPLYGGSARTRIAAVATIVESFVGVPGTRVRLVDLEDSGALARFSTAKLRWSGVGAVLSCRGSDLDVFGSVSLDDLASLLIDVLHNGGDPAALREAGRVKQRLLDVARRLDEPKTLQRLQDAVRCALTGQPPSGSGLGAAEQTRLLDYHNVEVKRRRDLADVLDRLADDLATLAQYGPAANARHRQFGSGPRVLGLLSVDSATGVQDYLLGRELLSRYVARQAQLGQLAGSSGRASVVIVLGAGHLAPDVLGGLVTAAERDGFRLLLFFDRLTGGPGEQLLGAGGAPNAVFFTLGHPDDAQKAAEFLGRSYRFVVNGHTVTDGTSREWSTSTTVGSDQTTSRSWNFGQGFGSSVTKGMSSSRQQSTSGGGGSSHQVGVTHGRVHEFVLEPEEFKRLPEGAGLVIAGDEVTLTWCNPTIRRLPLTASTAHP